MRTFTPFRRPRRLSSKALPPGLRASVDSGLILPDELSREQQVWTKAEWKLLERATTLLHDHGIAIRLQCQDERCQREPMEPHRLPDGSFRLRCAHMDRVMTRAF